MQVICLMKEDEIDSTSKKRKQESITRTELEAAAKDLDLLQTLGRLNISDDQLGTGLREIRSSMQQELGKPKPRSSVYKGIQRLKSANLVRKKKRRIPETELHRYPGWRVKRKNDTKEIEVAENGKIEVQHGFELTPRGEDVAAFIEGHLVQNNLKKEPKDKSGDNMKK